MDAGHRDDALGRVQGGEIERRPTIETRNRVAGQDAPTLRVFAHLGIEVADAKPGQLVLIGKVPDDADEQINPPVGAGVPSRANDHRHAEASRREQHRLEIVHLPLQRARRDIRAERYRPDIA
ncbi:MAG: hypothetical protein WCA23_01660 [Stellaceae bacterium]